MTVEDRVIAQRNQKRHDELCKFVGDEVKRFIAIGPALMELQELQVYKATHKTFESFINDTFGIDRRRAYQLIEAAKVDAVLCKKLHKNELPTNEAQRREIAKAPEEKQVEVAQIANEVAKSEDRKPTASDYRNAVEIVTAEPKRKEPEPDAEEEEPEIEEEPTIDEICEADNKAIESFCRAILKQFEQDVPKLPWTEDSGRIDSAVASLKAGLTTLRGAKSVVCPACVEGRTEKGKCCYCKGNGYLPVYQAKAIPQDAQL